jgi:predicted small metal-binding protein
MNGQDQGASPDGDRAVVNGAASVSALRASVPSAELLDEIVAHLGAAISQSIPTDDQRIMEHVRAAHGLASILRRTA